MSTGEIKTFANLGVRAPNLEAELEFLKVFGATDITKTERVHDGHTVERWHLHLGDTKMTLFKRATYDDQLDALGEPRGGGIGHAAFVISGTDEIVARLAKQGITPLIPTFIVEKSASGPRRKITYFRSPNGTVIETQDTIE